MAFVFEATLQVRKNILEYIKELTQEQLLQIPEGFNNNIAWHLGHMLTSQQSLTYALSGVPINVPMAYVKMYKKGSSPKDWESKPNIEEIKALLLSTMEYFEKDYLEGKFVNFKEYATSVGVTLKTIEDTLIFNLAHENQHIGVIQSMTKLVK
jgi:uncharacterized damage-inducible protein DinB